MYNKITMVIDTETYGGFKNPQLLQVGYVISDNNGAIFEMGNYYIQERINQVDKTDFIYKNLNSIIEYSTPIDLQDLVLILIEKINKVDEIRAYNSRFDMKVLKPFLPQLKIQDIMKEAKQFIPNLENYKFETVYKKLWNIKYQEQHTALQDSIDEHLVLQYCLNKRIK